MPPSFPYALCLHFQQTLCVEGDHCSCSGGFVCSDTKSEGECARGTGGYIFCEKKNVTDAISTISTQSTTLSSTTLSTVATTTQTIATTGSTGTCEPCTNDHDCNKDFFCCPFQLLWYVHTCMHYPLALLRVSPISSFPKNMNEI